MATNKDLDNYRDGLPTKQQLLYLMQRYTTVRLIPIDNNEDPMNVSTDTANFKKPIFNIDGGKAERKLELALQYQSGFPQVNAPNPSRILIEGNLSLVNTALNTHKKLLGDDPYNPKQPFEHPLMLMEGLNIPEYDLYKTIDDLSDE